MRGADRRARGAPAAGRRPRSSTRRRRCSRGSPTTTSRSSATASTTARGRRRRAARASRAPGLGLLRGERRGHVDRAREAAAGRARARARAAIRSSSPRPTRARPVHRPRYLDYVGVKRFDDDGDVVGERRFLGLYTTAAYREVPGEHPGAAPQGRRPCASAPASRPAATTTRRWSRSSTRFPRDELFQIDGRRALRDRDRDPRARRAPARAAVHARATATSASSPASSSSRAIASTPQTAMRDRRDPARGARRRRPSTGTLRLTESVLVRIHYTLARAGERARRSTSASSRRSIVEATRAGTTTSRTALLEELGEEHGTALFRRYGDAFPAAYRDDLLARSAVADVQRIEALEGDDGARPQPLPAARGAPGDSCAASSTAAASACRSPTCCRCSRASG